MMVFITVIVNVAVAIKTAQILYIATIIALHCCYIDNI